MRIINALLAIAQCARQSYTSPKCTQLSATMRVRDVDSKIPVAKCCRVESDSSSQTYRNERNANKLAYYQTRTMLIVVARRDGDPKKNGLCICGPPTLSHSFAHFRFATPHNRIDHGLVCRVSIAPQSAFPWISDYV